MIVAATNNRISLGIIVIRPHPPIQKPANLSGLPLARPSVVLIRHAPAPGRAGISNERSPLVADLAYE